MLRGRDYGRPEQGEDAVARRLGHVTFVRCTASIMRCSTGPTNARASSGSRSRISSVDSLMLACSPMPVRS